jgi:cytidylate kinase
METRDRADATREDSPLRNDETYTVVDTSDRTVDEVVEAIVRQVRSGAG